MSSNQLNHNFINTTSEFNLRSNASVDQSCYTKKENMEDLSPFHNTMDQFTPDKNPLPCVITPKNKLNFENVPITPDMRSKNMLKGGNFSDDLTDINNLLSKRIIKDNYVSYQVSDNNLTNEHGGFININRTTESHSLHVESFSSARALFSECTNLGKSNSPTVCGSVKRKIAPSKNLFSKVITRDGICSELDSDVFHADSMPEFSTVIEQKKDYLRVDRIHSVPAMPVCNVPKPFGSICNRSGVKYASDFGLLVGDLSRSYSLPVISKNPDGLVFITADILSQVINGICLSPDEVTIVDCRYPYEYEGGHILNAINLYSQDNIIERFIKNSSSIIFKKHETQRNPILIFHCEFSSARAPNLARYLRNKDRHIHSNCYPKLFYPEIYVLEGGYKVFFEKYSNLCVPSAYISMDNPLFTYELIKYSKESKNGSAENQFNKSVGIGKH